MRRLRLLRDCNGLAYRESRKRLDSRLAFFHRSNVGHARADMQRSGQVTQAGFRSDCIHFDASVVGIASPTGEAESAGFVLHKESKADALHCAGDEPAFRRLAVHKVILIHGRLPH